MTPPLESQSLVLTHDSRPTPMMLSVLLMQGTAMVALSSAYVGVVMAGCCRHLHVAGKMERSRGPPMPPRCNQARSTASCAQYVVPRTATHTHTHSCITQSMQ
eukprot:m.216407 g.216407  ORF g.216407 m.216407 type:complete len:103 (-) comp28343_c0_seq1:16-324(-)